MPQNTKPITEKQPQKKKIVEKSDWVWMPHAGHLIVGNDCRFHLNTYVNGYIVSTVGEWWPDRKVREIHAQVTDMKWLMENKQRLGDDFDHEYMKRFGYEEIGYNRTYETMVFKAKKEENKKYQCCPYSMTNGEIDADGYNNAVDAFQGHLKMCKKFAK